MSCRPAQAATKHKRTATDSALYRGYGDTAEGSVGAGCAALALGADSLRGAAAPPSCAYGGPLAAATTTPLVAAAALSFTALHARKCRTRKRHNNETSV